MNELKIPNHVAIIMDGNGRWAQNRGLIRSKGHEEGSITLEKIAKYAVEKNIKVLSVFAFSTENWKRSKQEVDFLMNLFIKMFNEKFDSIKENGIKVIFSGIRDGLNDKVQKAMDKIVFETKDNTRGILNICLNYGGQNEIVEGG